MTAEEQALFGIDKLNVPRSEIPAVTHVDYSARIQTVHGDTNPLFHQLLSRFKALTGCPVLVNTSFNVRGEPIVCTPEDAFRCFMGNELDCSSSVTACCRKPIRTPLSEVTTACHSIPIDAAFYSITSSAPLISEGENSMPRILAAFRLMKSSTFVTSWTGRSEGFSPLRIRPA